MCPMRTQRRKKFRATGDAPALGRMKSGKLRNKCMKWLENSQISDLLVQPLLVKCFI